jgi:hypothetical protein
MFFRAFRVVSPRTMRGTTRAAHSLIDSEHTKVYSVTEDAPLTQKDLDKLKLQESPWFALACRSTVLDSKGHQPKEGERIEDQVEVLVAGHLSWGVFEHGQSPVGVGFNPQGNTYENDVHKSMNSDKAGSPFQVGNEALERFGVPAHAKAYSEFIFFVKINNKLAGQFKQAVRELEGNLGDYHLWHNNCTHKVIDILKKVFKDVHLDIGPGGISTQRLMGFILESKFMDVLLADSGLSPQEIKQAKDNVLLLFYQDPLLANLGYDNGNKLAEWLSLTTAAEIQRTLGYDE